MEEQRIGALYWNLWKRRVAQGWQHAFPRGFWHSPLVLVGVLAVLIVGPGIAFYLHRKGQFHKVRSEIQTEMQGANANDAGKPGGVDPIVLTRAHTPDSNAPEFLSMTVLPGLGMSVLQITAYLPGGGESPLLDAPALEAITQGTLGPPSGANDDYGAFEVPWGGELMGGFTPVGTAITADWQGHTFEVPTHAGDTLGMVDGGLLGTQTPDESHATPTSPAPATVGIFKSSSFDNHWISRTDTTVRIQMTGHWIDLTVQTTNTGEEPEPMGIGWHPRFALKAGSRDRLQLRLPGGDRLELVDGKPSGRTIAGDEFTARFASHGSELGPMSLDETLVDLKPAAGENAPAVEIRNSAAGYGLRMTAASATIRALRVTSPAESGYISLGMQTNRDDPFGKEWIGPDGSDHSGVVTLKPGESTEWKVRLEIFPVAK